MTIFGVTGHTSLTRSTQELVRHAIHDVLTRHNAIGALTGITCLARGADQIFADVVLQMDGRLEVIVPAHDYDQIPDPASRARYTDLLSRSAVVHTMDFATSSPAAYLAASHALIDRSEHVLAIWDGSPPDGRGGTADAVEYAKTQKRPMTVIWPAGAQRM